MPYPTWRKLIWVNRNWTGKLQVTPLKLLSAYISWKKLCLRTFKASWEEVIWMCYEKMKAKYIKEDVWKRFFFREVAGCHLATSLQINFFTKEFPGILCKWTPLNGYFSILYKMIEKHLWNNLLLYLVVETLQLVHERGCLCNNWKSSFLSRLIFNWRKFWRWVIARWWRQWANN